MQERDMKKKRPVSKRVSFIFSGVFNPRKRTIPKSHTREVQRNYYGDGDGDGDGGSDQQASLAERQILKRSEYSDETSGEKKSVPFKKLLDMEFEKQEKANAEKRGESKKPRKSSGSVSLIRIFGKKSCSFSCMKGSVKKLDTISSLSTSNSYSSTRTSFNINTQNHSKSTGRSSQSLSRVPSRILTTRQKLKMAHSLTNMGSRRKSRKEDRDECESLIGMESGRRSDWEDGVELCKKRILMGWRCRPLNKSGTLQYDKDGILLPDVIP